MRRLIFIAVAAAATYSGAATANNDCPDRQAQTGDNKPCQSTTTTSTTTTSTTAPSTSAPTSTITIPDTTTTQPDPSTTTPSPESSTSTTSSTVEQQPPPSSVTPATTSPSAPPEPLDRLPNTGRRVDVWPVVALLAFGAFLTLATRRTRP